MHSARLHHTCRCRSLLIDSLSRYSSAGGTVEPDEQLDEAALREAIEETGLTGLRLGTFLGDVRLDQSDSGL